MTSLISAIVLTGVVLVANLMPSIPEVASVHPTFSLNSAISGELESKTQNCLKASNKCAVEAIIAKEAKRSQIKPIQLALRVAQCESGLNPQAKNTDSSASGLFQLTKGFRDTHCPGIDPFNAQKNTECALSVMAKNLNHWSESFQCWKNL